jgi:hypothetical protein
MDDTSLLVWGLIFGAIGLGYMVYGKRQKRAIAFLAGVALIGMSYFISNVFGLVLLGAILMALPFFLKI